MQALFDGKVNLHTHTYCCRHGSGNIADYMVWAEREKFAVLGFSEHVPLPGGLLGTTRIRPELLQDFWKELDEAAEKYPHIKLPRALEGEYIPELMEYQKELKESQHLDYMIASNHYIWQNGTKNQFPTENDPEALKIIVEQSIKLMESRLGIFFAHPDLFFAYGAPWTPDSKAASKDILEAAKALKVPLEINAYGIRKQPITAADGLVRKRYPIKEFWELAAETGGIEVVCSSDAHTPSALWRAMPEILQWADELGLPVINERLAAEILGK
jgi:histidinol-phosphatase (PHP family)